jgi:hypothetical protein
MKNKRGKHTSVDECIVKDIKWLEKQEIIDRVILGVYSRCKHKYPKRFLRILSTDESRKLIKIRAYTGSGLMELVIIVYRATDIPTIIDRINKYNG